MPLPTAPLGRDGPQVSRLGFGVMGLSGFYGNVKSDAERLAVLDHAHRAGELFWDSSDLYVGHRWLRPYTALVLIGKWFAANPEKRKDIFLATKFAVKQEDHSIDSSPEYCKQAIERSLKRLGIEQIDLYYCHRVDRKTPIEKTVEAMAGLKKAGKIRYLGLSEVSSDTLRRAFKVHPIVAVQVEYSPFALDIESAPVDLLKTCRELGVAVVAYSPLSRGLLTGAIQSPDDLEQSDFRRTLPRFSAENFPKNRILVDSITSTAREKKITPGQLTLAWLLAQGNDIFPIPGTTNITKLDENIGSVSVQLSKEEEQKIRQACEEAVVEGTRWPEIAMWTCFADTPPLD